MRTFGRYIVLFILFLSLLACGLPAASPTPDLQATGPAVGLEQTIAALDITVQAYSAAQTEAARLRNFQAGGSDPRIDGGYYFGRKPGQWLPYVNPVSTAFALQALALWEQCGQGAQPHRHLLI